MASRKIKFVCVCCFCNKGIAKKGVDPVTVYLEGGSRGKPGQTFWCHADCFKRAMNCPYDLREDLGGPKVDFSKFRPVPDEELPKFLRRK